MVKSTLVTLFIIILLLLLSFFLWHFFLSIYEVKFDTSVDGSTLNCDSELTIKTIGVNSLGWELPFRTIISKVEISNGQGLFNLSEDENLIKIKTFGNEGEFSIKVIPELSLNPTKFSYKIVHFKQH